MTSNTLVLLKGIREIALTIAAIGTLGVAIWTVDSWKDETLYKIRYEAANKILLNVYKLEEAIYGIRYGFGYKKPESTDHIFDDGRLETLSSAIPPVQVGLLRAGVLFGDTTKEKLDVIIGLSKKFEKGLHCESSIEYRESREEAKDYFDSFCAGGIRFEVFIGFLDKDQFGNDFRDAVIAVESELSQYMGRT